MFSDQSQRSFRIPRTFMATFLAVLVTLGMCWSLYENHVSARKSYLIERNFRFLARQGDNLVQAVAAYKYHFQSIPEEMWKGVRSRIPEQSSCDGSSHLLGPKDNKTPSQ